jgi:dCMP deaminase
MNWDDYFFSIAETVARKSKDRSIKVGCVITQPDHDVVSVGYNGFPRGADDSREEWHVRPKKYLFTSHAEENAICNAARHGKSTNGCIAYVTLPPCARCARILVQSGIIAIHCEAPPKSWGDHGPWKEEFTAAQEICSSVGVELKIHEGTTGEEE